MARIRVLIADDNREFAAAVAQLIAEEFVVVSVVADGEAAIAEVTRLDPDVALLDITMPVLNGLEVARRLRASGFLGKIIFLTVHQDDDYVLAAHAAGANGFVAKSRLASDLVSTLKEVLAGGPYLSHV